jgi:hypothetical protein
VGGREGGEGVVAQCARAVSLEGGGSDRERERESEREFIRNGGAEYVRERGSVCD